MRVVKILSLIVVFATLFSSCGNSTDDSEKSNKIDYTKFKCLKTLEGHSEGIFSVSYSPNGTKLSAVQRMEPLRYGMHTQDNAFKP